MKPNYREPERLDRVELDVALCDADPYTVSAALISAAYYDSDRVWVERRCLDILSTASEFGVRAAAITALGHVGRIHRAISADTVLPALEKASQEPYLRGYALDALDDIRFFAFGEGMSDEPNAPDGSTN